jgi:hypothetical protein
MIERSNIRWFDSCRLISGDRAVAHHKFAIYDVQLKRTDTSTKGGALNRLLVLPFGIPCNRDRRASPLGGEPGVQHLASPYARYDIILTISIWNIGAAEDFFLAH